MPERIQRKRTKGWKLPPKTVVVDRSTPFGNPFPISQGTQTHMGKTSPVFQVGSWNGPGLWFKDTKREAAELSVAAFRAWITSPQQSQLLSKAKLLKGKNLACWCKPGEPCHVDVLLELANT